MKSDLIARKTPEVLDQMNLPIGVVLTDVSLDAPQTLDDEQVFALGAKLRRMENASQWWVADFAVFVQTLYSGKGKSRRDAYDRVLHLWPEYARSTVQSMASIARRVPPSIRSPGLSFEHHTHIATLSDEKNPLVLQSHYLKMAEQSEATAEQLRLMIADTRKGIQSEKPRRGRPSSRAVIDLEPAKDDQGLEGGGQKARSGLDHEAEPELMRGSHAQLAGEAQRGLSRLREWYTSKAKKEKPENFSDERKRVLVADLRPIMESMHGIVEIFGALTNAEQTGEY